LSQNATKEPPRSNELTLAGLRAGKDTVSRALRLYQQPAGDTGSTLSWDENCERAHLAVDVDREGKVQTIRIGEKAGKTGKCRPGAVPRMRTGKSLKLGDSCKRVVMQYGPPDSRSPSTKGGQQLELLYYAFDWAGPDVPQAMEVLCTPNKDGKPGRVVGITLAAASL
jgi:hypothetical protein